MLIGVISDTHGLLRPEIEDFLKTCDHIIHAGDIGEKSLYKELKAIGPLTVVRGNVDNGSWAEDIHMREMAVLGHKAFYVVHNISDLDIYPQCGGFDFVVYGHSHKAEVSTVRGVTYLNPGSAGPRRFGLPVSYAMVEIVDSVVNVEIKNLEIK